MELTGRLIPSRYIREKLSENSFQLSDFNKATMIWNANITYSEKLSELKKLCDSTEDDLLKLADQAEIRL